MVIEEVIVQTNLDPWLTLKALSKYSGLSVRTLRGHLTDPFHPLPHYRMKEPHVTLTKAGKRKTVSGKILVRRSDFDHWMEMFRHTPDLDRIVDEVVSDLTKAA